MPKFDEDQALRPMPPRQTINRSIALQPSLEQFSLFLFSKFLPYSGTSTLSVPGIISDQNVLAGYCWGTCVRYWPKADMQVAA
jgi:hypothetical protein